MKKIGPVEFPETPEELIIWVPQLRYRAIHSKVLLVAKMRAEKGLVLLLHACAGKKS